MCITPLSIDIALDRRVDKAVTRGGPDKVEFVSGNKAFSTLSLILFINSLLFFSIKKTGCLF